jgi:hypothetical protein
MRKCLPLIAVVFILSFSACKKEKIITVEVPQKHSWTSDSFFVGVNKVLLTSLPLNDSIIAVANRSTIVYLNANKPNTALLGMYIPGVTNLYSNYFAPSLSKKVSASVIDPDHLNIYATYNTVTPDGLATFTPAYSGSANSFKGLSFPMPVINAGYSIINDKYILAPTEIDFQAKQAFFSLITLNTTSSSSHQSVAISSINNLTLIPPASTLGFSDGRYFSASYYGKFFVHYYNQFFRVDTLGNIKAFGYSPVQGYAGHTTNMFAINNNLFALGNGKFFISQDQGETWSLFMDATGNIYGGLTYMNVGNDLYAVYNDQISKVTMSGNTFTYTELDNDGLKTNQITSINKCGKYIYVTTLSGLFYRDSASFNTPKKP